MRQKWSFFANILYPWGCTRFVHKCGHVDIYILFNDFNKYPFLLPNYQNGCLVLLPNYKNGCLVLQSCMEYFYGNNTIISVVF